MGEYCSDDLESKNIICCLEFLSQQAMGKHMLKEYNILQSAISEILTENTHITSSKEYVYYSDIINAFKFFAKFCLIKDPDTKKQIANLIENIDKEAIINYAMKTPH